MDEYSLQNVFFLLKKACQPALYLLSIFRDSSYDIYVKDSMFNLNGRSNLLLD